MSATVTKPKRQFLIAPSILSADFSKIGSEIKEVELAGCDVIHVDVMDGNFVPNITIGPTVIHSIRKATKLPLDVHLMIHDPIRYLKEFREAGSDWITVHVEACKDVSLTLKQIKKIGAKVGISLRPKTGIEAIRPFLTEVDLVLVMTVEPGFGGQHFMPDMVQKVKTLRPIFRGMISVDGGIALDTARIVRDAGADIFVAGSAIFRAKDRKKSIREFRRALA